jgi:hypothetical protein
MKLNTLVLSIGLTLLSFTASAQLVARTNIAPSISLAWTPSPSSTNYLVAGYNLYFGPASATYTNFSFFAGGTTATGTLTSVVRGGTYFITATALGTNGLESVYSNEVNTTVPVLPTAPGGLSATAH